MDYLKFIHLFFYIILLGNLPLNAQITSREEIVQYLFETEKEKYFRFQEVDKLKINEISKIISIDKLDNDHWVYAYANQDEFAGFLDLELPYEILRHPGIYDGDLNMKYQVDIRELQEWDFYPTYEAYVSMMYQFAEQYPSICSVVSIGNSVMGRQLLVARISDNIGTVENEPQVLYTSTMHGNETTGYVLMLRLIDYLLSNYGINPRVTNLVNNVEIWINPLANPDGTYAGGNNSVNNAQRNNALGVNLNRNFPDPRVGLYPTGPWQAETVAFMELAENNHFVLSVNIHGGAEVCNYPWDTWSRLSADDAWWQFVCHEYADTAQFYSPSGYMTDYDDGITNGYTWYEVAGGRQDYMNYFQQCREFTLEISDDFILMPPSLLPAYWGYNYRSFLQYMEQSLYGLSGTVKDSITGEPIRAEIYALLHEKDSSWVYSSLPHGNYYRLLHAGNYSIRFSAPGYLTEIRHNITITNHQSTVLNIKLLPEGVGGVEQNMVSENISIYPNPVKGDVVQFKSPYIVTKFTVYNTVGKEVAASSSHSKTGKVNLEFLDNGLYFWKFYTEEGIGMKRFIINR